MGYIYLINNNVNNKKYIGQTIKSIEQRWKEHIHKMHLCNDRPLYKAMEKYGLHNFTITLIEEVDEILLNEREKYWIQYYDSFNKGYNATLGGEGTISFSYSDEEVINKYNELKTVHKVAEFYNCDDETISIRLHRNNINPILEHNKNMGKKVKMIDPEHIIKDMEFDTQGEAAQWLIDNGYSTGTRNSGSAGIGKCINHIRPTYCGFIWERI